MRGMLVGIVMGTPGAVPKGVPGAVIAAFLTINVLSAGFVFDNVFGDAEFLIVFDEE